ncbi:MAG: hypothetical protein K0U52_06500, partial [Gammaproteobacteria bacterium]|nr:hypothetical protein [Gammaproteobacteria bacterium]
MVRTNQCGYAQYCVGNLLDVKSCSAWFWGLSNLLFRLQAVVFGTLADGLAMYNLYLPLFMTILSYCTPNEL